MLYELRRTGVPVILPVIEQPPTYNCYHNSLCDLIINKMLSFIEDDDDTYCDENTNSDGYQKTKKR